MHKFETTLGERGNRQQSVGVARLRSFISDDCDIAPANNATFAHWLIVGGSHEASRIYWQPRLARPLAASAQQPAKVYRIDARERTHDMECVKGEADMAQAYPKRKGLKFGVATEFTVFAPVIPGHEQAIREALKQTTSDPRHQEALKQAGILHEGRFVLFDDGKRLLFASSFDGSWDDYIDDFFVTYIRETFDATFSHCVGYPGSGDPSVRDWFMQHAEEAVTYVSSYPNATTRAIWKALALQEAFQQVLDNPAAGQALEHPALKPLLDQAAT
jgi:hypothetical protein